MMRVPSTEKGGREKDGKFTTYSDVFNYLLEMYSSDYVIEEADENLYRLVETTRINPADYSILLPKQVFQCGLVYSESSKFGIYIEGLHESIRGAV